MVGKTFLAVRHHPETAGEKKGQLRTSINSNNRSLKSSTEKWKHFINKYKSDKKKIESVSDGGKYKRTMSCSFSKSL